MHEHSGNVLKWTETFLGSLSSFSVPCSSVPQPSPWSFFPPKTVFTSPCGSPDDSQIHQDEGINLKTVFSKVGFLHLQNLQQLNAVNQITLGRGPRMSFYMPQVIKIMHSQYWDPQTSLQIFSSKEITFKLQSNEAWYVSELKTLCFPIRMVLTQVINHIAVLDVKIKWANGAIWNWNHINLGGYWLWHLTSV